MSLPAWQSDMHGAHVMMHGRKGSFLGKSTMHLLEKCNRKVTFLM
jgi:hypothetical protein